MTRPSSGSNETWWFGALCEVCDSFVPVAIDASRGRAGEHFARSGTVIVRCRSCGHQGRYAAFALVQRRTDEGR